MMNDLISWEPFSNLSPFAEVINRSFTGFWQPSIDVSERPESFIVRANLPGMNKNNVQLTVDDNSLTIQGEAREDATDQGEHYYRRERRFGSFMRRIPFHGRIREDQVRATFKDGVLEVMLPKAEGDTAKGRRIEIQ